MRKVAEIVFERAMDRVLPSGPGARRVIERDTKSRWRGLASRGRSIGCVRWRIEIVAATRSSTASAKRRRALLRGALCVLHRFPMRSAYSNL